MAECCRTRSTICARFRESAVTQRTLSRHLRSIDPFHWSKQTSPESWRACSPCAIRLTQAEAAKQFGIARPIFSPRTEQPCIIPLSWISARWSARHARRNVEFVRSTNFAARRIRKVSPSKNLSHRQKSSPKRMLSLSIAIDFCSSNRAAVGVACGFSRGQDRQSSRGDASDMDGRPERVSFREKANQVAAAQFICRSFLSQTTASP